MDSKSQQNNELVLHEDHINGLRQLQDDLLQAEINFCKAAISHGVLPFTKWYMLRLKAAEDEAERRFLTR
jgi:hypothetical protein